MSENILEYNFSNEKKPKSIKSIVKKICKLHSIDGKDRENICSGRRGSDYFISMWVDDVTDLPNCEALKLLNTFPSDKAAFAKLEMDTTGETFYYALEENQIMTFDSERSLSDHFDIGGLSIESEFYELVNNQKSHLLIRLKISLKEKLNSLLKFSSEYIKDKSDSSYAALKSEVDTSAHFELDFPFTHNYCKTKSQCEHDLGRRLMFAKSQGDYLFLGYEFPKKIRISPCRKEDAFWNAENNIENKEGLMLLELVESLLYLDSTTTIQAKFSSYQKGFSGLFWSREECYMEYSPFWGEPSLPARCW